MCFSGRMAKTLQQAVKFGCGNTGKIPGHGVVLGLLLHPDE